MQGLVPLTTYAEGSSRFRLAQTLGRRKGTGTLPEQMKTGPQADRRDWAIGQRRKLLQVGLGLPSGSKVCCGRSDPAGLDESLPLLLHVVGYGGLLRR